MILKKLLRERKITIKDVEDLDFDSLTRLAKQCKIKTQNKSQVSLQVDVFARRQLEGF